MKYINRITKETLTLTELCRLLNASIPNGYEVGDWTPVKTGTPPEVPVGSSLVQDGVEEIDGDYFVTWKLVENEPEPVYVPTIVSRYQGLAQLHAEGVLEVIETYFAAESTPFEEKLAWREIRDFERQSPLLLQMAEMLGWDGAKLDQVFTDARKHKA